VVVIGVLLLTGLWRREAAALAAALLVMFLVAVGYVMWQGIDVEHCGCFTVGGEGRSAGWTLIASDLGLLAAALYVLLVPPRTVASVSAAAPAPAGPWFNSTRVRHGLIMAWLPGAVAAPGRTLRAWVGAQEHAR